MFRKNCRINEFNLPKARICMKVIIYSPVDVFYYSFYIEGFYRLYGKNNVIFSVNDFPAFAPRILAARITGDGPESRIVIDALDTSTIYTDPLEWADVYGKVNYNLETLPSKNADKVLAIGPGFGIRIWSFQTTLKVRSLELFKIKRKVTR